MSTSEVQAAAVHAAAVPPAAPHALHQRAALYAALAKAQSICRTAELDGRFEGGKVRYPYTSTNERMAVARDALSKCGLALVRVGLPKLTQIGVERDVIDPHGEATREQGALWLLEQDYLLTHESGEHLATGFRWPVVEQLPFRPLDKAFAGADTSGLGYLIRDVLLIPSEESADEQERSPGARTVQMPSRPAAPPASAPPVPALLPGAGSRPIDPTPTATAAVLAMRLQPAPTGEPAAPVTGLALVPQGPDVFDQAVAGGPLAQRLGLEEQARAKLAAAPLAAAKLYSLQPEAQDKPLYLDLFAVAEKRYGSRERAIVALKELGNPQGTVPTVGQLRTFVEKMP